MATTKAGPISADRLKSFIERIEKLEEERKAIGGDIKDVYSEAKRVGYDVGTMRKIVALRAKDPADRAEQETLLDVYCHALGMVYVSTGYEAAQPSEEDLMEQAARIAGEVDRCMDLVIEGQPLPSIADIRELIGCSTGKASKLRGMIATRLEQFSRLSTETRENPKLEDGDDGITGGEDEATDRGRDHAGVAQDEPVGEVPSTDAGQADDADGFDAARASTWTAPDPVTVKRTLEPENEAPAAPSVGAVASGSERVAPPYLSDDAGPIPPFLDRRTAQGRGA